MERVLFIGKIVSTKDPLKQGRVQVELRNFPETTTLPWLRMVYPYASKEAGFVFLPEEGDQVAVLAGIPGHVESMIVLGYFYNATNTPGYDNADGDNKTKQIVTRGGNQVIFSDESGKESITVQTKDGKLSMVMDQSGPSLTVESKDTITVKATGDLTVEAKNITVKGSTNITVEAGSACKVKGANINVEASGNCVIKGASVAIN
ncbi:MAG: phage baseplate assembly protein V [Pseudomonadota bacterium]